MLDELLSDPAYSDRVVFYYRHYPFNTDPSYVGCQKHMAAEAAHFMDPYWAEVLGVGDSFWQIHDDIYEVWSPVTEADLFTFAADAGLDEAEFTTYYNSTEVYDKIIADKAEGQSFGVYSTPSIFVNGVKVSPWSYVPSVLDCLLGYAPWDGADMDAGI